MGPAGDITHEDWISLERVYRSFPSTQRERFMWRNAASLVHARLTEQGHHGLPALLPGLVHARLATALLAAGYHSKRELRNHSFLCLGCHAGLEIRILRDFGAGWVHGLEIRPGVVEEACQAGLVERHEISGGDFWEYLSASPFLSVDMIMALAPDRLSLERLWDVAEPHLVPGGHLVAVAQDTDILAMPKGVSVGPAMEGTMNWYILQRYQGSVVRTNS